MDEMLSSSRWSFEYEVVNVVVGCERLVEQKCASVCVTRSFGGRGRYHHLYPYQYCLLRLLISSPALDGIPNAAARQLQVTA